MAADNELPVWTIRPNWRNGVLERLDWLTDVLGGTYGTEQRRALRLSPRRSFEMTFNPINEARSYFDLWLHRMGSEEFMVPLFHDRGTLTAAVTAGQDTIPVDTTYREFLAGGMAVIIGDDPFTFDVLEITAVAVDELTVEAAGVAHGWPAGTAIFPLRRTRISQESLFAAITSRVGEAVLQFELNQENDIPDEGEWAFSYLGIPIIVDEPNRRERMDFTYLRNSLIMDNDHGIRALLDDAGRAFTMQTHLKMMRGRAEHWAFRQMLYRLRGQQAPIWLPTFNRDFQLSSSRLAADVYLDIKKIGYAYTGGLIDGREHIFINGPAPIAGAISGVGAAPTTAEERLTLSGALGTALAAGTTGSFLEIVRLSQDAVEISHLTDTDGVAECNLAFRAFRDERTPGAITTVPIPGATMRLVPCGEPQVDLIINLNAQVHCDFSDAGGKARGIKISGFDPSDVLRLTLPPDLTWTAYWYQHHPYKDGPSNAGSATEFRVVCDDGTDPTQIFGQGFYTGGVNNNSLLFDGPDLARESFGEEFLTGSSSYTFYIYDTPRHDNGGGLSIKVEQVA